MVGQVKKQGKHREIENEILMGTLKLRDQSQLQSLRSKLKVIAWGWTTKIDSAARPFLKIDRATWPFLKFDMRHGYLSDMQQGYFLNSTCDIGAKIISDMRHVFV